MFFKRNEMNRRNIVIVLSIITTFSLTFLFSGCDNKITHIGMAQIPSTCSEMKGKKYEEIQESLENKGFKNIKSEAIEDLITGLITKDGEVEEVIIGGKTGYSASQWVPAKTEVIIRYHTFKSKDADSPDESDSPGQTIRYQNIEEEYYDRTWKKQKRKYTGWIAQIIQHECDHQEGIII